MSSFLNICPECCTVVGFGKVVLKSGQFIHKDCLLNEFQKYLDLDLVEGFVNGKLVK